jgi:hypothetical protein
MTWMAVTGELQRDWARQDSALALGGILAEHRGGSGVAFAWEVQLLASAAGPRKQAASVAAA